MTLYDLMISIYGGSPIFRTSQSDKYSNDVLNKYEYSSSIASGLFYAMGSALTELKIGSPDHING